VEEFFPDEIQWLKGTNTPSFGRTTCISYERMQSGKMYVTKLGNQVKLTILHEIFVGVFVSSFESFLSIHINSTCR